MFVSRRSFLKAGAMVALASGIPLQRTAIVNGQQAGAQQSKPAPVGQLPAEIYSDPLFYYHKSAFTAYVNTKFRAQTKNGSWSIVLTLIEVKDIGPVPDQNAPDKECFSLLFRSPYTLRQNTYKLKHEALGTFDLFLVPLRNSGTGRKYAAIINRLNP